MNKPDAVKLIAIQLALVSPWKRMRLLMSMPKANRQVLKQYLKQLNKLGVQALPAIDIAQLQRPRLAKDKAANWTLEPYSGALKERLEQIQKQTLSVPKGVYGWLEAHHAREGNHVNS